MRKRLVLHFLKQYVENEWAAEADTHQTLALLAAGAVTIPLFATVFMCFRYLMRFLQAPGWTEMTAMQDQITFCAASMLMAALVATLEWDALSLSPRDAIILGVLPVSRREIVAAKLLSLVAFVGMFVLAVNLLPMLIHPPVTVVTLPVSLAMLPVLIAAHALSTTVAAALGFGFIVGVRELMYLVLGRALFRGVSDAIRSVLVLVLLILLLVVPLGLAGRPGWMLQPDGPPAARRPIAWCVAVHASIAGRVLQRVPGRAMPPDRAAEEQELRTRYESNLPRLTNLAVEGTAALALMLGLVLTLHLWNVRHAYAVDEVRAWSPFGRVADLFERVGRGVVRTPATRAGFFFVVRAALGSSVHRLYFIVALAAGASLFRLTAPFSTAAGPPPLRTLHLAGQTLLVTALITAFRAAIRTAADDRAAWLFSIADTGHLGRFRHGVRLAAIAGTAATVCLLLPVHIAAWGPRIAVLHAGVGIAAGWLLIEAALLTVDRPLVTTIPSNDALNTVGAVALGAMVIGVVVLAYFERTALGDDRRAIALVAMLLLAAAGVRYVGDREPRAPVMQGSQDRLLRLT